MDKIEIILQQWLDETERDLKDSYDRVIPTGFGSWKKSLTNNVTKDAGVYTTYTATIDGADYTYYAEYGRGTGKRPPVSVIRAWMDEKGIIAQGIERDSLAYIIARKIGEEGTKAHRNNTQGRIINPVITDERIEELYREINKQVLNDVKTTMTKLTKNNGN